MCVNLDHLTDLSFKERERYGAGCFTRCSLSVMHSYVCITVFVCVYLGWNILVERDVVFAT